MDVHKSAAVRVDAPLRRSLRPILDEYAYAVEMIWQLSLTEFKTRHFQRALSYLWWFLEPLLLAFTFFYLTLVLGGAGRAGSGTYAEIFMGVVLWQWFRASCNLGMTAICGAAGVLKLINFPPLILLFAKLLTELLNLFLALGLVAIVLKSVGTPVTIYWLQFPIGVMFQLMFTLAIVIWLSVMGVFVRDTVPIVNFGLGFLMYLSPIAYRPERVPAGYALFMDYNPFTTFMRVYTNTLIDGKPIDNWDALLRWGLGSLVVFVAGLVVFQKARKKFYRFL